MRKQFLYTAALVLLATATGCTVTANGTATTGTCHADSAITSCVPGSSGYSCTSTLDRPEDANSSLVCSTTPTVVNGVDEYCCTAATSTNTCGPDSAVTDCATGSYGYSCTHGHAAPDAAANSSLLCSVPMTVGGVDEYCCASAKPISTATCNQDQSVTGCANPSFGFACTGTDRPDADYPSIITCSTAGVAGTNASGASATLYCCVYNGTSSAVTCSATYQAAANPVCGSTCDACLQTNECGAQYGDCDSTCQSEITAMKACTQAAAGSGTLSSTAESTCSSSSLGNTNSASYALWWEVIRLSLDCAIPCCAVF